MRYISFAQHFEDIILFSALNKYVQKGVYVDIGANDPCIISVTKLFYDLGWRGINIEPLEDEYRLLCMERSEDENINLGVSDKNGELEMGIAGPGSSFRYPGISGIKHIKQVRRFEEIYRQSCFFGQDVHFCKIDVEGFEKNVLEGINFTEFRPWIFVIESVMPGGGISTYSEWEDVLIGNGYLFGFEHGANRYYVNREKEFLIEGLVNFRKMFWNDDIIKATYSDMQCSIRDRLDSAGQIAVFGAGAHMYNFFETYGERYENIIIVDNSPEKQGKDVSGIRIQNPEILTKYGDKNLVVLICCEKADEIKRQLDDMDIKDYMVYSWI